MKPSTLLLPLCAVLLLTNCAQVVTVTEIKRGSSTAKTNEPTAALERSIADAETAWRRLDSDPADTGARRAYNLAVSQIFSTLREAKLKPWTSAIKVGKHTLAWQPHPKPLWNPALYELIPTNQLQISGSYVDKREIKDGLGAALIAKRIADPVHDYAPTPHFFYAATGIARFEGARCVLALVDPLESETVRVGRRTFPLGADFTAPLSMMLVEMDQEKLGIPRLLHPAKFASTARIARLEPYDPKKTVVLLVHGLMSSPATWFPLINRLQADEDVRRNYQFWFFSYPSGYPYPYSAAILRRELDAAEKQYPMRKKMLVVGHSMGGCISRLLITDSERRIWDQMYEVPPEKMDLTPEHKHILTESSIFKHRPEIGRVIFISAPLQGADLATGWVGRLGARLVKLPSDMLMIGKEEARYEKVTAGHKHLARFPDSVDTLARDNDFVVALHKVPLKSGIPYHTICGDRGKGDAPKSSDGLVPYWSSHLPDALSEKIVPTHHNAQQHIEAIEEVHRILKLHTK